MHVTRRHTHSHSHTSLRRYVVGMKVRTYERFRRIERRKRTFGRSFSPSNPSIHPFRFISFHSIPLAVAVHAADVTYSVRVICHCGQYMCEVEQMKLFPSALLLDARIQKLQWYSLHSFVRGKVA